MENQNPSRFQFSNRAYTAVLICTSLLIVFIEIIFHNLPYLRIWFQVGVICLGLLAVYHRSIIDFVKNFRSGMSRSTEFSTGKTFSKPISFGSTIRRAARFIYDKPAGVVVLILLASLIFFWPKIGTGNTPSDVAYYLSLAKNLFLGNGYVNPDLSPAIYRGPIFPLLISFSYGLFGENPISPLILMRIFWLLTVFAVYFLGKELFNQRVGVITAFLVLSTGIISSSYTYIYTDGIVTCLMITSLLLTWKSIRTNASHKYFIISGLIMGIAYLTKQTAILIAPLGFLTWMLIPQFRTKEILIKLIVYYSVVISFIFMWIVYLQLAGASTGQVFRDFEVGLNVFRRVGNAISNFSLSDVHFTNFKIKEIDRGSSFFQIARLFYKRDLTSYIRYTPLLVGSITLLPIYAWIKKDQRPWFLLIALVIFLPVLPLSIIAYFGPRMYLYVYIIMLLALAVLFDFAISRLSPKTSFILSVLLVVASFVVQGTNKISPISDLSKPDHEIVYFPEFSRLAVWLDQNAEEDAVITMLDRPSDKLHIYTNNQIKIFPIETCNGDNSFYIAKKCTKPYIAIWVNRGITNPDTPRDDLLGISYEGFNATLSTQKVDYIVISPEIFFINDYLSHIIGIEKKAAFDGFVIYQVTDEFNPNTPFASLEYSTCLGSAAPEYFENLLAGPSLVFDTKLKNVYEKWMGLDRNDIINMINWNGCEFSLEN